MCKLTVITLFKNKTNNKKNSAPGSKEDGSIAKTLALYTEYLVYAQNILIKLGMMACPCNPSTCEGIDRRIS